MQEQVWEDVRLRRNLAPQSTPSCQVLPKSASPLPLLTWCDSPASHSAPASRGIVRREAWIAKGTIVLCPHQVQGTGQAVGGARLQTQRAARTCQAPK